MDKLEKFLIEAKKQTYANGNVEKVNSSRKGSNDYHYEKDGMIYHDTFFGGVKFIGEEVVYIDDEAPVWGMNYYGITFDSNLSEAAMDKALRPALMKVGEDNSVLPLRGPSYYENDGYLYTFKCEGTLESFNGVEEISKDGELIFKLQCHGGLIK